MNSRVAVLSLLVILVVAIFIYSQWYGPSNRVFSPVNHIERQMNPEQILQSWEAAGVKGRTAIVFTRRLNGEASAEAAEGAAKYLEEALQRGIVRRAFHYLPDAAWGEVSSVLTGWKAGTSDAGFTLLFGGGRVRVLPLSRFTPEAERSLVIIAPDEWSESERAAIAKLLAERKLLTDYVVLLRSDADEFSRFRSVVLP